jgi:hypothetical protein
VCLLDQQNYLPEHVEELRLLVFPYLYLPGENSHPSKVLEVTLVILSLHLVSVDQLRGMEQVINLFLFLAHACLAQFLQHFGLRFRYLGLLILFNEQEIRLLEDVDEHSRVEYSFHCQVVLKF